MKENRCGEENPGLRYATTTLLLHVVRRSPASWSRSQLQPPDNVFRKKSCVGNGKTSLLVHSLSTDNTPAQPPCGTLRTLQPQANELELWTRLCFLQPEA